MRRCGGWGVCYGLCERGSRRILDCIFRRIAPNREDVKGFSASESQERSLWLPKLLSSAIHPYRCCGIAETVSPEEAVELEFEVVDESRTLVDEGGIDLDKVGARTDFFVSISS